MEVTENLQRYNEVYKKWYKEQYRTAKNAFASEITGEVPKDKIIEFRHKFCIGGSTDAVILGVSPWATPNDAYESIYDMTLQEDKFAFRYGHYMEKFVATEFSRITKLKVKEGICLFAAYRPWSMAQLDFLLEDDTPLEIKTTCLNSRDEEGDLKWGKGCEFNANGELLCADDKVPVYYFVQCQKQLDLTGKDYMYLACLISADTGVRIYKIQRNEEIIKKIRDAEDDFMFNHVIPKVPYVEKEIKELETVDESPNSCYATYEFIEIVKELNEIAKEKNELCKRYDAFTDAIRDYLGVHDEAVDTNGSLVVKQTKQTRRTLDTEKLKNENAELVSKYYVEKPIASKITVNKKYFSEK